MILRQRTFCLFTLSLGCLALLLSLLFWRTTSPRADLQDREALTQDLRRIHQALEAERLFLAFLADDWGQWTEIWRFAGGENPGLPASLGPQKVMGNLRVSALLVVSPKGRILHREAYDLRTGAPMPLPSELRRFAETLGNIGVPRSGTSGFLGASPAPLVVAAHPVLPSSGSGVPRGFLVVARILDSPLAERARALAHRAFRILPPEPSERSGGWFPGAGDPLAEEHLRIRRDGQNLLGTLDYLGLDGHPAFRVRISAPRAFFLQARGLAGTFSALLVLSVLGFGLTVLLMVDQFLLKRLERVTLAVDAFDPDRPRGRIPQEGNDELTRLEGSLNRMIRAIRSDRRDRLRAERELRRSHRQLARAYESTLQGWSLAMDLRDKETEDHTLRVTAKTLELARHMGFPKERMVHLRRGALLHDIGKLGVPDRVLLKPGPLTEDEWVLMRRHPTLAEQMLRPIDYLRPARPIPTCHHEKWDGTGYPRGLKGEEIPLEARIFAVVDVWDALTSRRPYREPWPPEKVRGLIREGAGSHFDPAVVAAFLDLAS